MSTRGCVALKRNNGWQGTYNHLDSYPTILGKTLWDTIKQDNAQGIVKLIEGHPQGFSSFPDSPYPPGDPEMIISSEKPDSLLTEMEWVYIIDPENRTMTILARQGDKHNEMTSFSLDGEEPDWEVIEERR